VPQEEVDRVLGASDMPNLQQYGQLAYVTRAVCESMRLYPHPPVLLRRARVPDVLPGGYEVGCAPALRRCACAVAFSVQASPAIKPDLAQSSCPPSPSHHPTHPPTQKKPSTPPKKTSFLLQPRSSRART
jgi:hypothetical protein